MNESSSEAAAGSAISNKKKVISFFKYVKQLEQYEWTKSLLDVTIKDPNFPWCLDKNIMLEYLKNGEVSLKVYDDFIDVWESYITSEQADKESRKVEWIKKCERAKKEDDYLIKHYCYKIRGKVYYYDQTYEEMEEQDIRTDEYWEETRNQTFRNMRTPWSMLNHNIDSIGCQCKAENLKQGIYCKTCKLMLKVHEYMMDLFKDAAEGRSTTGIR